MEPSSTKQPKENNAGYGGQGYGGYGGGYGGYGGYGYGYGETNAVQRNLQDYLLILRERIWYVVVVFLVVFSSALVYTLSQPKIYQAAASVQIFRQDPTIMQVQQVVDNGVKSAEDLNTQIKILESGIIIQSVAARLTGEDLRQFTAPFSVGGSEPNVVGLLAAGRKILPQRQTLILLIAFEHPDRFVTAKIANLFVEEYIAHNLRVRIDESLKAVQELDIGVEAQKKKVEQMARDMQAFREKNNMISLDGRKDMVNSSLLALNGRLLETSSKLKSSEIRWSQIKERRATGADLTELSFVAVQVSSLISQISSQKITLAQLRLRYRNKHPKMETALKALAETEGALKTAIDSVCAQIESDYQTELRNYKDLEEKLAKQTAESLELDRFKVEYDKLERDTRINEQILSSIIGRSRETTMNSSIESQNARIVDRAVPPPEGRPISPNVSLNLSAGAFGGLALGLVFAFFVAYIDDRVKSSFDIESVVGLPLVGIVPEIKRLDQPEKAQIVANNQDKQVVESFLTLHSSLRLKDESKRAQAILVTSTIPGEGKTMISCNLAASFARHGKKSDAAKGEAAIAVITDGGIDRVLEFRGQRARRPAHPEDHGGQDRHRHEADDRLEQLLPALGKFSAG